MTSIAQDVLLRRIERLRKIRQLAHTIVHDLHGFVGESRPKVMELIAYLLTHRYLLESDMSQGTPQAMVMNALKKLIHDGSPAVGDLHDHSLSSLIRLGSHWMAQPRCGAPMREAFGVSVNRWGLRQLRYFVRNYVEGIDKSVQNAIYAENYRRVSEVCDMRFSQVFEESDAHLVLDVSLELSLGFGQPSGTLASAGLPPTTDWKDPLPLDFDGAEMFVASNPARGILLQPVHLHETLHNMGVSHVPATRAKALINPFYDADVRELQPYDIDQLRLRYGPKSESVIPISPDPDNSDPASPSEPQNMRVEYDAEAQTLTIHGVKLQ